MTTMPNRRRALPFLLPLAGCTSLAISILLTFGSVNSPAADYRGVGKYWGAVGLAQASDVVPGQEVSGAVSGTSPESVPSIQGANDSFEDVPFPDGEGIGFEDVPMPDDLDLPEEASGGDKDRRA